MSRKKDKANLEISRRHFLHGAGGFVLSLPLLPSLLSREARAATSSPRRFLMSTAEHGALRPAYLYPYRADESNHHRAPEPGAALTAFPDVPEYLGSERQRTAPVMEAFQLYPGHFARRGALTAETLYTANGCTGVSPVLSSSRGFSAALLSKMHLHQGLDLPLECGHSAVLGGNYSAFGDSASRGITPIPSIDQLLAYSPKVYPAGSGYARRCVVTGGSNSNSFVYENTAAFNDPGVSGGKICQVQSMGSAPQLFKILFENFSYGSPSSVVPPDKLVVDRVLASWSSLRNGAFGAARRLSMDDRTRLDGFMENLYELQRRLGSLGGGALTTSCRKPTSTNYQGLGGGTLAQNLEALRAMADVIALAFACDLTRVVNVATTIEGFDWTGDTHQEIWHNSNIVDRQRLILQGNQRVFENLLAYLAEKLNAMPEGPNGETVLDHSLLFSTNESGPETHCADSLPVVAFGGLGGTFKTGYYYDYRGPNLVSAKPTDGSYRTYRRIGIHYGQFLVSILRGMGLSESDYSRINLNRSGYGDNRKLLSPWAAPWDAPDMGWTNAILSDASKPLPVSTTLG
jgi:hypothetical protein